MKTSQLLTLLVLIVTVVGVISTNVSAQSTYQYAYLSNNYQTAEVTTIDPRTGTTKSASQLLSRTQNAQPPYSIVPSPDGQWVAIPLIFSTEQIRVHVTNVITGEDQDITLEGVSMVNLEITWSPNSQQFAIVNGLDVIVHEVISNMTSTLTDSIFVEHYQSYAVWSLDSAQLATLTHSDSGGEFVYSLDIFDVSAKERIHTVEVFEFNVLYAPICQISWSPEKNYISFRSACNASVDVPQEIFLWDIRQNQIDRVTNYTLSGISGAEYATFWVDENTLLISSASFTGGENVTNTTQTITYQPQDKQTRVLNDQSVGEWALNPLTKQLAFQEQRISGDPNRFELLPNAVGTTKSLSTRGSNLSANLLAPLASSEGGCHLAWSPDGTTLAYTVHPQGNCDANIEKIVFIDGVTGASTKYLTPAVPEITRVTPIGWIVVN